MEENDNKLALVMGFLVLCAVACFVLYMVM